MANLSRKIFKEGLERAVEKGAALITNEEVNISEVVNSLVKSVRSTTGASRGRAGTEDPTAGGATAAPQESPGTTTSRAETTESSKSVGSALFRVAKSVDSLGDLQQRIKSNRGEFANLARNSRSQLVDLLTKLTEPDVNDEEHTATGAPPTLSSASQDQHIEMPPPQDV